jgi:cell division protein FtsB
MKVTIRIAGSWVYGMRRVLATLCITVLAVFIGYKVIFGANGMQIWQQKRAEYQKLEQQIDAEKKTNEQLQRQVDALQRGDASAIEKEAREQFGWVRPGEHVLFEGQSRPAARAPATNENSNQK